MTPRTIPILRYFPAREGTLGTAHYYLPSRNPTKPVRVARPMLRKFWLVP